MITLVTLVFVLGSLAYSLGGMTTAVFRRDAAPRFLLSDMLALVVIVAASFAVVLRSPFGVGAGTALAVISLAGISWLIAIYLLSCAGVGNAVKRIVFTVLLPCSIVVSSMGFVCKEWAIAGLFSDATFTWRMPLCLATLVAAILLIRRINDWVASVDSQYEVPTPARALYGKTTPNETQ